ncbi:MAG TPA: serine/threonine-protein kinase [Gemmatimonadales bacterium]|nr:serine/threonine-protein kinase [Gemmatimonadales bacterium]
MLKQESRRGAKIVAGLQWAENAEGPQQIVPMLIERVRRALAQDYEIHREVAGGGMGVVFAARQARLDRIVAIKILRPELATAVAAERFLDEGKILARLAHPSIVPIYAAGEADGLFYYVMEFVDGETLAARLERGTLSGDEMQRLADDLLGALGAAHALGVVHRDVKSANVFLRNGRALLGDFGISRWRAPGEAGYTTPGQLIGTVRYMAPEQRQGEVATERTDVYCAALLLWEACIGKHWPVYQEPERADWSAVPLPFAPSLRRALALAPEERFAHAGEFQAALRGSVPRRRMRIVVGGLLATAALATGAVLVSTVGPSAPQGGLALEVEPFEVRGIPGTAFRDSLHTAVLAALSGYPDLRVLPATSGSGTPGAVRIAGTMTLTTTGLRLELRAAGGESGDATIVGAAAPGRADWAALVGQVSDSFMVVVWKGTLAGDEWLPLDALPRTGNGLGRWHAAERLYAQSRWEQARDAYSGIEMSDPSCLLCTYRLIDIARWLGTEPDSLRFASLNRHLDAFPSHYRAVILAQQQPWPHRYDSLVAAAHRYQGFYLASFLLGDELFHRGPLYGHLRSEALEPLQHAMTLRPDFAPGWEHLGWVSLAEATSGDARTALDSAPLGGAGDGLSNVLRIMLQLGYLWRFGAAADAELFGAGVLQRPEVVGNYRTASGGRLMMTADAPAGAVGLGAQIVALGQPEAIRSGLLAEAHGFAALGRLDSLRAVAQRFPRLLSDHALSLYGLELEGALTLAESDDSVSADPGLIVALRSFVAGSDEAEPLRVRAAWMLALLAARAGDSIGAAGYRRVLGTDGRNSSLLDEVDVAGLLHQGDTARAGRLLLRLRPFDLALKSEVPVEDAVRRLLHVAWLERTGASNQAVKELRWPEHLQLDGFPTGDPQSGEVGWALGTALRWRRAVILDRRGNADLELCTTYLAVARLWTGADPRFAARARFARSRAAELKCGAAT